MEKKQVPLRKSRRNKKSKLRKWIIGIMSSLLIIAGSIIGYTFYNVNQTLDQMYQPVERENTKVSDSKIDSKDVKTFLILGADQRPGDKGRTDGIIYLILNDRTKKITMVSIPRDTYVEIAGTNRKDKINAAYPLKGIGGTIATVENVIGIPVEHYIWFNMEGFQKAIDAIGGVKVDVDQSVATGIQKQFSTIKLPGEGEQVLNGEQALFFSRFRYDSKGDFGRNERQQKVLKAFINQSKDVRSPIKINALLNSLGSDVRMDITKDDLYSLAKKMNDYSGDNVEQIKYNATTGPINGISYVFISDHERDRITEILKTKMNEQ